MARPHCSPEYAIAVPGFEDPVFTAGSSEYLALPAAVAFARARGGILQSACEAVAFRIAADGTDGTDRHQLTRTSAIYFKRHGVFLVAFDDYQTTNILLTKAAAGYRAHARDGAWLIKKSHPLIRAALRRATRAHRILPVPRQLVLCSTSTDDALPPYGTSPIIHAVIGDLATPYAQFLHHRGHCSGTLWVLSRNDLRSLGVDEHTVEVRAVSVGASDALYAVNQCTGTGRARGVRTRRQ